MLCAFVSVCVNVKRLMETGKGRYNGVGFTFVLDLCGAESDTGAQDLDTQGLGTNPSAHSSCSAWYTASQLIAGPLATIAHSSAGKLCCIWPCNLITQLGEPLLACSQMCLSRPERGLGGEGRGDT